MKHLGVFAKYWEPGGVKTRLASDIGKLAAARLYREFVSQTLWRLGELAETRSVWIWPPGREPEFRELAGPRWTICHQSRGDLGRRMRDFFLTALPQADRVILIGSDSPSLPTERLSRGWAVLEESEVVLGPATDGGYYLVGMNMNATDMFERIPWSTPAVLATTVDRLAAAGRSWQMLDPWRDIDTLSDLHWLQRELESCLAPDAHQLQLLAATRNALGGKIAPVPEPGIGRP